MWSLMRSNSPIEIARWSWRKYENIQKKHPGISETEAAKIIFDKRYNIPFVPEEFKKLRISNRPYIDTIIDACYAFLNMESEGGRDTGKLVQLTTECIIELMRLHSKEKTYECSINKVAKGIIIIREEIEKKSASQNMKLSQFILTFYIQNGMWDNEHFEDVLILRDTISKIIDTYLEKEKATL